MSFKVGDRVQIIKSEWNKEALGKTGEIRSINGRHSTPSYTTYTVRLDEPLESLKGHPNRIPDEVHCLSQELSLEK